MENDAALSREPRCAGTRGERLGWYFYDWANSAFYTTVVATFLSPYLTSLARAAADPAGFVHPLGIRIFHGSYWSLLVSLSVALQAALLPLLGAIADYSGRKKSLLVFFAYLGAVATMAMFFLHGQRYLLGGFLFVVANFSFGASIVFYNAFLPEIATENERDSVSSFGWAIGYLGGGLLLAANLALVAGADRLGLTDSDAVRLSLFSAGAWWALFSIFPLATLRRRPATPLPPGAGYVATGLRRLRHTLSDLRRYPQTLLFLFAYMFFNDGIQTVIVVSAQFGHEELDTPVASLAQLMLMVQFVAFAGAILFNFIAKALGARNAILLSLVLWTGVVLYAYGFLRTTFELFLLGAIIGIVLGGSQALSRSLFSLLIPNGREAEYFSLYEISERGTSWLGPFFFALALQFTGSYRLAILSVVVFFLVGMALLAGVDVRRGALQAGNQPPERA